MSSSERPTGPIRQLSLQQQSTRRHQHIRRQRSADDEKYSSSKFCPKHDDKPKLRIAWGEIRPKSRSSDEDQVQIVARQISSKSRPLSQKVPKKSSSLDKASILYSHQELAERLRLAWKQREERRANIDIFLARNTCEERCESALALSTAPSTPLIVNNVRNKVETNEKFRIYVPTFDFSTSSTNAENIPINNVFIEDVEDVDKANGVLQKKQNMEVKLEDRKKLEDAGSFDSDCPSKMSSKSIKEDPMAQVKMKRAGFRSGMNKAFVGPINLEPPSSPRDEDLVQKEEAVESKFRKTVSSAPSQRVPSRPSVEKHNSVEKVEDTTIAGCDDESIKRPMKSAPLKRRIKCNKRRGFSFGGSKDGVRKNRDKLGDSKANDVVTMVSLVSSADSDSDVDEQTDDKLIHELRNKLPTTPIIKSSVRPVSTNLRRPIKSVSFHQSSFNNDWSSKDEVETEEKKTPRQNFVTEVSCTMESNSTSVWKTENFALPLLQLPLELENPEMPLTEREKRCLVVPIGDLRDKKRKLQRTRSAGPKLIETPCPPISLQESHPQLRILQTNLTNNEQQNTALQDSLSAKINENSAPVTIKFDQRANSISTEPSFQTTKEKECWHLYRRMCDKGVCVSFDTVLRGMLTPTEYRLRQREMSQNV